MENIIVPINADGSEEFFEKVESHYAQDGAESYRFTLDENIFVVEDSTYETLTCVKYEKAGKFNLWSLGVYYEYNYVFYVPVGTVTSPQIEAG